MPVNSYENYPMSWKPDLSNTKPPLYLALVRQLEDDIKAGVLAPGTKLPPQRELADYLDINLSTVSRAFKICEQKGLLSASVGNFKRLLSRKQTYLPNPIFIITRFFTGKSFEVCALQAGVQVFGAERFTVGNKPADNTARISVITPPTINELTEGLERLRRILS